VVQQEWGRAHAEGAEAAMFNFECWMMNIGAKRRTRTERQATAESARRVARATKWGKMGEDVFAAP
jgi:hypothetical protein